MAHGIVLVTGGTGYIGYQLCKQLAKEGYEVTTLSSKGQQSPAANHLRQSARIIKADLSDLVSASSITPEIAKADYVIHLAGLNSATKSMGDPESYERVNIDGTRNLISLISQHGAPKKIILASSRAVYGEGAYRCPEGHVVYCEPRSPKHHIDRRFEPVCPQHGIDLNEFIPSKEGQPPKPVSIYGATKLKQEELVSGSGFPYQIFRLSNIYGHDTRIPGHSAGLVNLLTNRIIAGKEITVYESGGISRDFFHVGDAVKMIISSLNNDPIQSPILNLGSEQRINLVDLAYDIGSHLGIRPHVNTPSKLMFGDVRNAASDTTLLHKHTNPSSLISLEEGIMDIIDTHLLAIQKAA
ncbi:MAG: NAD(P)-dependent oxidoreductase [Nanoarchaeota archaeon]